MKGEGLDVPEKKIGLGWASILMPLALGFGLSLMLAYQAYDARREHRVAAQAALRDQAAFAAYLLASSVDRQMRETLLYGFYPVDLALGRLGDSLPSEPLPSPGMLRAEPEASRCGPEYQTSARRFFRFEPVSGRVVVDGDHPQDFERWVWDNLDAGDTEPGVRHVVAQLDEGPSLIVYRRWGDAADHVVYGFESCWRTAAGNVFEEAAEATQAFSPALVRTTSNDSLFVLTARMGDGSLAHGERWSEAPSGGYSGSYYGMAPLEPANGYGGLELRVTLLPQVAERLVEGGLPRSGLPLALGLLTLNGLLMWVAVRQLRRSHELVGLRTRFVRNVSHELRTPLQQMLLFTELLQSERIEDGPKRGQALAILHTETRRLIELVRNVLSFSGSRENDLVLTEVALLPLVTETVEAFRPLAAAGQATIEVQSSGEPQVRANGDALKRVLINLLDNAVKYGPAGQRILVQVNEAGGSGRVSVSDHGPGVPDDERDRIWEPFKRLDREEEGATAGSGIGLSIVRRLALAMGGDVEVGDGPTAGATFTVRLPQPEPEG